MTPYQESSTMRGISYPTELYEMNDYGIDTPQITGTAGLSPCLSFPEFELDTGFSSELACNNIGDISQLPPCIVQPTQFDVMCGRDKSFDKHYGNLVLREMTIEAVPLYRAMRNMEAGMGKKKFATQIVRDVINGMKNQYGARFVRLVKGRQEWEELPENCAQDKVSHALRTYIKKTLHTPSVDTRPRKKSKLQIAIDLSMMRSNSHVHTVSSSISLPNAATYANCSIQNNPSKIDCTNQIDYIQNDEMIFDFDETDHFFSCDDADDEFTKEIDRLFAAQQENLNKMIREAFGK